MVGGGGAWSALSREVGVDERGLPIVDRGSDIDQSGCDFPSLDGDGFPDPDPEAFLTSGGWRLWQDSRRRCAAGRGRLLLCFGWRRLDGGGQGSVFPEHLYHFRVDFDGVFLLVDKLHVDEVECVFVDLG